MKTKRKMGLHAEGAALPAKSPRRGGNNPAAPDQHRPGGKEKQELSSGSELQALRAESQLLGRKLQEARDRAERAEMELAQARDEIETRVRQRSGQLARANENLRQEMLEHRQDEERIQQQNEFLNHVLESLTHPFYVLDANDYTIKMANSAAVKGELRPGITCYALTHHRDSPCDGREHGCPLQIVKETKKPVTLEHVHYDREGNPRNVEVHGYPIFDRDGKVMQMLEYSLDITERKLMEQQLRDNAEKIKLFAYAVSHDLKSPMVGMLGLIRLLHRRYGDQLDAKGKKFCEQILKGAEQMSALVEEINAYIKAKETVFHFEPVYPLDILHTVRDEFAPLLSLRGISWSEPDSLPVMSLDRLAMIRVFRNLTDNAVKYGGEKLSAIAIGYRDESEQHLFSFFDDGAAIRPEDREKIFEVFGRPENARGIEGTGLGLAIVREIVGRHQGRIWVESAPAAGVTFYISLPKQAAAKQAC